MGDMEIDLVRLELEPEHTKSWCRPRILLGSLVGRNRVEVDVALDISIETRVHLLEEECVVQKQPLLPRVPF